MKLFDRWMWRQCERYGQYPCNDLLNNALRLLAVEKHPNRTAIEEICYAIRKAGGYFCDDVIVLLEERYLAPFPLWKRRRE